MLTEKQKWALVRQMLDSGKTAVFIAQKLKIVTAEQIYAKNKVWKKEKEQKNYRETRKYHTPEYKAWRAAVLKKDNYKCIICGRGRGEAVLQCDHKVAWAREPALRYAVSNGRVLCKYHHKRTLNFGRKASTYKNDADEEWIKTEKALWLEKEKKRKLKLLAKKI